MSWTKRGSRSRSRSRKEKTFVVKYYYERWEMEPNVYIIKAKTKRQAEDIALEYYAQRVIEKEKYPSVVPDEVIIKEFKRLVHSCQRKNEKIKKGWHYGWDVIHVDKYSFDFAKIKSEEVNVDNKFTPLFLKSHNYW